MNRLFLLYIFLIISFVSFGQTRNELEKMKKQNEKDILYTNQLLSKTEQNKKDTYNNLVLLNTKIKVREELISNIQKEIRLIDSKIIEQTDIIAALQSDYEYLKKEYAKVIYNYYKNRSSFDRLMFVFASDNVNTAYRRMKYLQQYSKFRSEQFEKIIETKKQIQLELDELSNLKQNRISLLETNKNENTQLLAEQKEKNKTIKSLELQRTELIRQLENQKKLAQSLNKEIERVIKEEIDKANKASKTDVFKLTPEEQKLAKGFSNNKSKLPWPTERGVITSFFGENPHPFLKGVVVRNDGIDISTTEHSYIRSIYEGIVSRVFVIPGAHTTVIIRHGNYLTVYSNLAEVFVKQGDNVKTKQTIGKIFSDKNSDNKAVLQFQIWKENQKLDPKAWLTQVKDE